MGQSRPSLSLERPQELLHVPQSLSSDRALGKPVTLGTLVPYEEEPTVPVRAAMTA